MQITLAFNLLKVHTAKGYDTIIIASARYKSVK